MKALIKLTAATYGVYWVTTVLLNAISFANKVA